MIEKEIYITSKYHIPLFYLHDNSIYKINNVVFVVCSLRVSHFCRFSPRRVNKFERLLYARRTIIRKSKKLRAAMQITSHKVSREKSRRGNCDGYVLCRWILFAYRISLACYAAGESVYKDFCDRDRIIMREFNTQNYI